jgi:quinol monooxygenase YgiN
MGSAETIQAAAKATDETDAAIDRVCAMLEHYRDRNALRVYAHADALRAHLAEAREAIARAEEIVRKARWPTDEDYNPGSA